MDKCAGPFGLNLEVTASSELERKAVEWEASSWASKFIELPKSFALCLNGAAKFSIGQLPSTKSSRCAVTMWPVEMQVKLYQLINSAQRMWTVYVDIVSHGTRGSPCAGARRPNFQLCCLKNTRANTRNTNIRYKQGKTPNYGSVWPSTWMVKFGQSRIALLGLQGTTKIHHLSACSRFGI